MNKVKREIECIAMYVSTHIANDATPAESEEWIAFRVDLSRAACRAKDGHGRILQRLIDEGGMLVA